MLYGSMFFLFGSRLLGRSNGFLPLSILAFVVLFSIYDQGAGLRNIFTGTWHGIPMILIIAACGLLLLWLNRRLDLSTRAELSREIAENEAAYTAANRPGGWKQYYGIEDEAEAETQLIPDEIRRRGWQPGYSDAADRLAEVARQHRMEQQRRLRETDNRRWMKQRTGTLEMEQDD